MPTVQTNGIETYYDQRGSGPAIVFVHAAILDSTQWNPQVEALSGTFTTITYDLRGHGRTGGSATTSYSMDLFASDLDALITALDLDRPVVCGHSTGGCIAQVYAASRSDRLSGLVLADTWTPELFNRREWLQRSLILRATIPPVRLVGYERVEKAMVWLQERISGEGASGDYENIEQLRTEGPKMSTDEFTKVIHSILAFEEMDVDYSAISVPSLVLYGENELPFVPRHARKLSAGIQNATLGEVPDAGHASNLDNPAFYNDALMDFVSKLDIDRHGNGGSENQDVTESV